MRIFRKDWSNAFLGKFHQRAAIVAESTGNSLRVNYPQGSLGPNEGGGQFRERPRSPQSLSPLLSSPFRERLRLSPRRQAARPRRRQSQHRRQETHRRRLVRALHVGRRRQPLALPLPPRPKDRPRRPHRTKSQGHPRPLAPARTRGNSQRSRQRERKHPHPDRRQARPRSARTEPPRKGETRRRPRRSVPLLHLPWGWNERLGPPPRFPRSLRRLRPKSGPLTCETSCPTNYQIH